MSARRLLLIDSDDNFFRILHEHISPYGFEIYRAEESPDALDHVPGVSPQLICIAVEEPDKVGYSLCNRAKKGVAKDIPVILTTSSVPPSGFHSHRKLKVHADEYIDKRTMSTEELISKIDVLVGLSGAGHEEMSFDDVEEFDISEDGFDDGAKTRIAPPQVLLELDPETEAAVASLTEGMSEDSGFDDDEMATSAALPRDYLHMSAEPGEATVILSERRPPPRRAPAAPSPRPAPVQTAPQPVPAERASRASGPVPVPAERASRASGSMPALAERASRASGPMPVAASAGRSGPVRTEAAVDEQRSAPAPDPRLLERLRTLERDNERLKADLEAARQAGGDSGASSFSRERELLNLREVINKKERELLDLRDELGSKERQILEGKEQVNQLQHSKAALDSKNLDLEQRLLKLNEQLESERAGAHQAVQELQARLQELEQALSQASSSNAQAAAEIESLGKQLGDERAERERAVAELTQRHAHELEATRQQVDHERHSALEALRGEHEARLSALGTEHAQAVERLDNEHEAALSQLRGAHAHELQSRDQQHQQQVQELGARHAQELEALEAAHVEVMARREREHQEATADAEARRDAVESALREGLAEERSQLERAHAAKLAELENERSQLEAGLGSARQSVAELERSLEQAGNTVAERDQTIGSLKAELEELEKQNTGYQEQVLKAFQKIKADEATVAKAKKAMAIALTLLDDNITGVDDAARPGSGSGERLS